MDATSAQLRAQHLVHEPLTAALDVVGALRVTRRGEIDWSSLPGDDSGEIACVRAARTVFNCTWEATLIQSYEGTASVTFTARSPDVVFSRSTCANLRHPGGGLPKLCALDPMPGMPGAE